MSEWISRVRFFFAGKSRAAVDDELQFHLERQVEANLTACGMSLAGSAPAGKVISFGGPRARRASSAATQRPSWSLESCLRDLRYGLRGASFVIPAFTAGRGAHAGSRDRRQLHHLQHMLNQALLRQGSPFRILINWWC